MTIVHLVRANVWKQVISLRQSILCPVLASSGVRLCLQRYHLTHYPVNKHINLLNMRLFFHVFRSLRRRRFLRSSFVPPFHRILLLRVFVLRRSVRISIKFQFYNVNVRMQQRQEWDSKLSLLLCLWGASFIQVNAWPTEEKQEEEKRKTLSRFVLSPCKAVCLGSFSSWFDLFAHTIVVCATKAT